MGFNQRTNAVSEGEKTPNRFETLQDEEQNQRNASN